MVLQGAARFWPRVNRPVRVCRGAAGGRLVGFTDRARGKPFAWAWRGMNSPTSFREEDYLNLAGSKIRPAVWPELVIAPDFHRCRP